MSKYTTGEIAKLCKVTVRTVQYYDTRGILIPSELSDGGRRLYTEADLKKMKVICFLREIGFSIKDIGDLMEEEDPESVIMTLLDQREKILQEEVSQCQGKLQMLGQIKKSLKDIEDLSLETIGDIAHIMKNKVGLKKVRTILLVTAILVGILEWGSILLWILKGIWWPFVVYTVLAIPYTAWIFWYYWNHVSYICPQCHTVFKPNKKEFSFAKHTFATRKVTCTCCGHKGYCVETYGEQELDKKI